MNLFRHQTNRINEFRSDLGWRQILLVAAALIAVHASYRYNYLLFHSAAELFSVCIAVTIFVIVINTNDIIKNTYVVVAGTSYLFTGILDTLHLLTYKGMGVFTDYDYYAPQFWIAARYIESFSMLGAFVFVTHGRRVSLFALSAFYSLITAALVASILIFKTFPVCFVAGSGLTPFKIVSEYVIVSVLALAILTLYLRRRHFEGRLYRMLTLSIVLMILTEICFTLYFSDAMSDSINEIGHLIKICSFYILYKAVVVTGFRDPISLLFRELQEREERYRVFFDNAAVGTAEIALDRRFLRVNDRLCRITGHAPADLLALSFDDLLAAGERGWSPAADGPDETAELRCVRGDGREIWIAVTATLIRNSRGAPARFIAIIRDISQRKGIESDLRQAKAEAERANLAKSKFLATASHDLRQPVQSLVLFLTVLKDTLAGTPTERPVRVMEQAVDALGTMLSGLLDLSRLDAGIVLPHLEPVDLNSVLQGIGSEYEHRAREMGLELRVRPLPVSVLADPTFLDRVLRNLMENALRYTERGGLLLACRRRGSCVRIDMVDTGIGIPAEHLGSIFDEYFQIANDSRERTKGLGLGLSIVQRLVALMGGRTEVRSRQGHGSCFSVTLPLTPATESSQPPEMPSAPDLRNRIVVVVDDDELVLGGLRLLLEGWGAQVVCADGTPAALDGVRALARPPDAIIADYRLRDGETGIEVAHLIHSHLGTAIPTMIITGDTAPERIKDVQASGFRMLHKPVNAGALFTTLAALLADGR